MTDTKWQRSRAYRTWLGKQGRRKRVKVSKLTRARLLRGLSAQKAADMVGVPQPTWVGWEALGEHRRSPKGSAGVAAMAIFRLSSIDLHEEPYCYVDPATLEIVP